MSVRRDTPRGPTSEQLRRRALAHEQAHAAAALEASGHLARRTRRVALDEWAAEIRRTNEGEPEIDADFRLSDDPAA